MAGAAAGFTGTAKLVFAGIRMAFKFAPTLFSGLEGLIASLQAKAADTSTPLVSVADIHEEAERQGVDLDKVMTDVLDKH